MHLPYDPQCATATTLHDGQVGTQIEAETAEAMRIPSEIPASRGQDQEQVATIMMSTPKQCQKSTTYYPQLVCYYFPKMWRKTTIFTILILVESREIAMCLHGEAWSILVD